MIKMHNFIFFDDCLDRLKTIVGNSVRLIYIDPPFNTGKIQNRGVLNYKDKFDDFIPFLMDRVYSSLRLLRDDGSIFIHLDYREVHYVKVEMDKLMGRDHFMGEIIWAYDYGARSKKKWSAKHDTILWYVKKPGSYVFNYEEMDRIPYMAPGLQKDKARAARGKPPTDVWWHTIVPTNGKEKTGYPTQKPLGILSRIIRVHSDPQDYVLDFFAGSGTTGEAAGMNGRGFILIDNNVDAIEVMLKRLAKYDPEVQ